MIPYSLLDLAPVPEGFEAADSFRNTLDLARQAERVIVVKNGRIEEDGPPELLEREGRAFRDLFLDVLAG